jgi:hypothetical protein
VIWHIVPILDGGYVHESDICLVRAGLETLLVGFVHVAILSDSRLEGG